MNVLFKFSFDFKKRNTTQKVPLKSIKTCKKSESEFLDKTDYIILSCMHIFYIESFIRQGKEKCFECDGKISDSLRVYMYMIEIEKNKKKLKDIDSLLSNITNSINKIQKEIVNIKNDMNLTNKRKDLSKIVLSKLR